MLGVLVGSALACGGSGGGGSAASAGIACGASASSSTALCPVWRCVCKDGQHRTAVACAGGVCGTADDVCGGICADDNHGGVDSYDEAPTVRTSAECDALVEKERSLGCNAVGGTVDDCTDWSGGCPDNVRAYLKCVVETGTWTCGNPNGEGTVPTVTSQCPRKMCFADAGDAG